jgi:hypothetical protein
MCAPCGCERSRSNSSGNNVSTSLTASGDSTTLENCNRNGDNALNNNDLDNGVAEICDVPDSVANQKRHVSI